MKNRNILISGAGIAGLTLAYWLKKFGFNPTVVEKSPKLREGGYAIDFWGAGFDVAERMKLVPDLEKIDLGISKLLFVDDRNKQKGAMDYRKLKRLLKNRAFTFLRSDLSTTIYNHLDSDIEMIFGDTIENIDQTGDIVAIQFRHGGSRTFDLLVGADGLHSNVRNIIFGSEVQFEKYFGYYTASFTIKNSGLRDSSFLLYNIPNKQAAVYSTTDKTAAAFFIFASPQKLHYDYHNAHEQKDILRDKFHDAGWKCDYLISNIDDAPDFYFDVVSQIQMNGWSKNRVTLVGDAGYCPSLLSGQGSALAMIGAYVLAGELKLSGGDYQTAFKEYEKLFAPLAERKQKSAQNFAKSFVPKTKAGIWIRNAFTNLMFLPFVSRWFLKEFMDDRLQLKDY